MIQVTRCRLPEYIVHEFYQNKMPNVLKPSNSYQVYIIKIKNPDDKIFEYSELVLIETSYDKYYPVLLLGVNISDKYTAYMCDIKHESEEIELDTLVKIIPTTHLKRLERVLERL